MTQSDSALLHSNTGEIGPLLDLEMLDDAVFRNRVNDANVSGALYGGQVLSQALHAATRTVDDSRAVHSLHGYFLRAGDTRRPVLYTVERTRDGGSFSTRRVTAVQHGRPIFHMECSFHATDEGFDYEVPLRTPVPPPEDLMDMAGIAERYADQLSEATRKSLTGYRVLEIRPIDPERLLLSTGPARGAFWIRIPSAAGLPPPLQACALTYASDSWLAPITRLPHTPATRMMGLQVASLDHAMWFHRPARADDWRLYEVDSPWTGDGRGLARGTLYDREGRIVASTMQEALLRRRRPA